MFTRSVARAAGLFIAVVLVAAACSDSDDSAEAPAATFAPSATTFASAATTAAPAQAQLGEPEAVSDVAAPEAPAAQQASGGDTGGGVGGLGTLTPTDIGRDIVFTATLTVMSDNVAAASQAALDAIAPLGGLLFGQDTTTEPRPRTVLILKVLPEDFQEALARLGGIGELRSQQVRADDVTDRIVDLQSRISTADTSVERLRILLSNAVVLQDVAALERELLNREQALEQLRGQLRTIEDAVGLATITVIIEQTVVPEPNPAIEIGVSYYSGDDGGRGCPVRENTSVDEGDVITVCFEVTNTGDTLLGDIEINDRVLRIEPGDVVLLSGTEGVRMTPEETWTFTTTIVADRTTSTETRVTATPYRVTGDNHEPISGKGVNELAFETLQVRSDDSLPGFDDAFSGAVDVLKVLIGLGIILAGAAIPFLWIPVIVFGVIWFRRERARRSTSPEVETPEAEPAD